MTMNVLDVSNHQSGMTLSGYDGYIFKATEGIDFVDKYCDGYVQQAKKLGKPYGVYHFLDGSNVKQQANYFYTNCKGYLNDAIFILDFEAYGLVHGVSGVQEFCSEFTRLSGINCVLYMSESVVNENTWNKYIEENHAFWVAKYSSNKPVLNNKNLTMIGWQYTSTPLDKSYFYIDVATWNKYAFKGEKTTVKKEIDSYYTSGTCFKAKQNLQIRDINNFASATGLLIDKGQIFDISELINNKGLTTHAKLKNGLGLVTLHKDYVEKVK